MKIYEHSKILLICLGLDYDKTNIQKLNSKNLRDLFQSFGIIERVLIFSKKQILKAFIEFQFIKDAQVCRQFMHNCFFNNYGRVRIYYSNKKNVTHNSSYLDYYSLDFENKRQQYQQQILKTFKKNKKNQSNNFQNCLANNQSMSTFYTLGQNIEPQFLIGFHQLKNHPNQNNSVLLVFNLPTSIQNIRSFYNYFSCFGDIKKITQYHANFFKIKFQEEQFAQYILSNYKKISIENMQLYSNDKELTKFLKNNSIQKVNLKKKDYQYSTFFFKQKIIKKINFPSQSIIILFPKINSKFKEMFFNQVIAYQMPVNFAELACINFKRCCTLILKYLTLQQSILVIAKFGTCYFNGKFFKIIFFNNNITDQLTIKNSYDINYFFFYYTFNSLKLILHFTR